MTSDKAISEVPGVWASSNNVKIWRMTSVRSIGRTDLGITRRSVALGLPALFALSAHTDALAQNPTPAGRVDKVSGMASAEVPPDKRPLSPDDSVFVGDAISTAEQSRLELHLGQDTTLRLGEKARIKIDRFLVDSGGEITLESGPLVLDKDPNSTKRPVRVRGPFGLITVRGTRLFAGPSQGVFGVLVVRGSAVVEAADVSVTLRSGEGTDIRSPGTAPTRPRRWGNARARAALASVD